MGKAIGIDFGTTNTVVTYQDSKGKFRQLKENGKSLIPSVIFYNSHDSYDIGHLASKKLLLDAQAGLASFKSLLCQSAPCELRAQNGDKIKQKAVYITSLFLNRVFENAKNQLLKEFGNDGVIDSLVITVPTGFNDVAKAAIRKAVARATGLDDARIRREYEPTAAAIAAMQDGITEPLETILVYDFGGGTFDISLIKREGGVYREITRGGDVNLGGNTLTRKVMIELLKRINENYGTEFPLDEDEFDEDLHGISFREYKQNMLALFQAANQAKEELSELEEADISFPVYIAKNQSETFQTYLTRAEFERLAGPEIRKTVDITARLLEEQAARDSGPVEQFILAGGSSSIPMVRRLLEERFPGIPVNPNDNASTIISCGAAILAQKLEELDHMTSHVTSYRLGVIATEGMRFNKFQEIIPENQPLPCEGTRDFSLAFDDQRMLDIHYYEYDVKKNPNAAGIQDDAIQEVDVLHVELPPGLKKADTIIAVRFSAKKDGSLEISAQIKDLSGKILGSGELAVSRESEVGW